jgi:hypothetical protein
VLWGVVICFVVRAENEGDFRVQVHTLFNPTPEQFLEAQRVVQPNFLYIQGQQLEDEKEIGSLVWGDNDVSDPQAFSCLISPPFPTIVSTNLLSSVCNICTL